MGCQYYIISLSNGISGLAFIVVYHEVFEIGQIPILHYNMCHLNIMQPELLTLRYYTVTESINPLLYYVAYVKPVINSGERQPGGFEIEKTPMLGSLGGKF